jgi:hypothetical protein
VSEGALNVSLSDFSEQLRIITVGLDIGVKLIHSVSNLLSILSSNLSESGNVSLVHEVTTKFRDNILELSFDFITKVWSLFNYLKKVMSKSIEIAGIKTRWSNLIAVGESFWNDKMKDSHNVIVMGDWPQI